MDKKEVVIKNLYPWQEDQLTSPEALLQKRDRVKAFYAFILALTCYCFFLVLIFLEVPQTYLLNLAPQKISSTKKKSQPAPVRWAQPPSPPSPPSPPLPPLPPLPRLNQSSRANKGSQTKPPPLPPALIPHRPSTSPKSVLDPQKAGSPLGKKDALGKEGKTKSLPALSQAQATPQTSSPIPPPPPSPRRQRSSKNGWLKKDMPARKSLYQINNNEQETPEPKDLDPENGNQQSAAQAWDQNFRTYLERRYGKPEQANAAGSGNGSGTGSSYAKGNAERLGNELFLSKLVYAICDTSHQRPLHVSRQAISLHTITVWITLTNKRTITEISFEKSSPYPFINRYIEELIRTTAMPQLPFDWHEESLTVPLRVRIEVAPQMKEITLIPAFT